jgi:hypothetical protein
MEVVVGPAGLARAMALLGVAHMGAAQRPDQGKQKLQCEPWCRRKGKYQQEQTKQSS